MATGQVGPSQPRGTGRGCLILPGLVVAAILVWWLLGALGITGPKFEVTNSSGETLRNLVLIADRGEVGGSTTVLGRREELGPGERFRASFDLMPPFHLRVEFDGPRRHHRYRDVRYVDADESGPWNVDVGPGFVLDRELPPRFEYRPRTLRKLAQLARSSEWQLPHPPRNREGMLLAYHAKTGLGFVLIPEGSFRMGSPAAPGGRDGDEGPAHAVRVPAFLLCATECTRRAWDSLGGEDDREWTGQYIPIIGVGWERARAWCVRAGLRLPSEAEWEYACRARLPADSTLSIFRADPLPVPSSLRA